MTATDITRTDTTTALADAESAVGALQSELEFVIAWRRAQTDGIGPVCSGRPAEALIQVAFNGQQANEAVVPANRDELAACRATYEMAPAHVQELMAPTLVWFHDQLVAREQAVAQEQARQQEAEAARQRDEQRERAAGAGVPTGGDRRVGLRRHELVFLAELLEHAELFDDAEVGPGGTTAAGARMIAAELAEHFRGLAD